MTAAEYSDPRPPLDPPFEATIPAMLAWIAARYGDREAQVRGAQRLTYRQLETRSAELARGLLARGVGKGTRVAFLMPNGPDFTVAFMAAARIGALAVPLSTLFKARELGWVLRDGDFHTLLTASGYLNHDYLARLEEAFPTLAAQRVGQIALADAPYLRQILVWGDCDRSWAERGVDSLSTAAAAMPALDNGLLRAVEANVVPADLLCMIYTSGSSATPKGVVHTHGAMLRHSWQKAQMFWALGLEGDRLIGPRPQFWVAGLAATLIQILLNGCTLLDPEDISGPGVLRLIEAEGATGACGNQPWLRSLAADSALREAGYELFIVAQECAAFARRESDGPRFLHPERARRHPAPVHAPPDLLPHTYGMTESLAGHTSIPAGELLSPERATFSGRPMPGVRLRLIDAATGCVPERGAIGEIQIAGRCMMDGLYKRERSATFTQDGWYPTGDLAFMDEDGFVRFHSRMGEMLKISGANVAPAEVEGCLTAMPEIIRAAVLGLPAADGALQLVAAVELCEGHVFDEQALREKLKEQLSSYKVPKRIFALPFDAFPLTASGKIRKPPLAQLLAAWPQEAKPMRA